MKIHLTIILIQLLAPQLFGQNHIKEGDSLKQVGLILPAYEHYKKALIKSPSKSNYYKLAAASALLWTKEMRDSSFYYLNKALKTDSTLRVLGDAEFLSLIEDSRWTKIEQEQFNKYEAKNGQVKNKIYAKALYRMIIKDQGFMYAGNIERKKYIKNGGYFSSPSIYTILALEEKNHQSNEEELERLLNVYGWPTASEVTEWAAAGAALIINHSTHEKRMQYFPLLEKAFKNGEAQPLRYAKMYDRLLVEQGKKQLYGTQIKFENLQKEPYPIFDELKVDFRRKEIGLGPLGPYLKEKFNINWKANK